EPVARDDFRISGTAASVAPEGSGAAITPALAQPLVIRRRVEVAQHVRAGGGYLQHLGRALAQVGVEPLAGRVGADARDVLPADQRRVAAPTFPRRHED